MGDLGIHGDNLGFLQYQHELLSPSIRGKETDFVLECLLTAFDLCFSFLDLE